MTAGSDTLYFAYDSSSPMSVTYNGTVYYYVTNLQGDIVAILDTTGTAVVEYTYDAWGNLLTTSGTMASTLGAANPLTYRGYVYDAESGLYYLQSRYYNANVGRFLNADSYVSTGQGFIGCNMFAYCRNNPVRRVDISGRADVDTNMTDDPIQDLMDQNEQGGSGGGGGSRSGQGSANGGNLSIPQYATDVKNYIKENGSAPSGYRSGDYSNDGRNNTQVLPPDSPYTEYDVHPFVPGVNRGQERIVMGGSGRTWYTADHYYTFTEMK